MARMPVGSRKSPPGSGRVSSVEAASPPPTGARRWIEAARSGRHVGKKLSGSSRRGPGRAGARDLGRQPQVGEDLADDRSSGLAIASYRKADVFSGSQSHRGKSPTPGSLDGRVEGDRDSEAQSHREDGERVTGP